MQHIPVTTAERCACIGVRHRIATNVEKGSARNAKGITMDVFHMQPLQGKG
jgi:hypothetical protein